MATGRTVSSGCILAVVAALAGCNRSAAPVQPLTPAAAPVTRAAATAPATAPVAGTVEFKSRDRKLCFRYPAAWHPAKDDTILTLVPAGETTIGTRVLVVDDEDLPPHIPGLIPMPLVAKGFVDDLRQRYKGLSVDGSWDRTLAGAKARLTCARGEGPNGRTRVTAMLVVRDDHVYLIDAETDAAGADSARAAFDTVVNSFKWSSD